MLILAGGLLAAAAQLPVPFPSGVKMLIGLGGAFMAFLGGVLLLFIEKDYVDLISEAKLAVTQWREGEAEVLQLQAELESLRENLVDEREQLLTYNQVLGFWDRTRLRDEADLDKRLEYFLLRAVPRLVTAMRLGGDHIWTFSVFRKQKIGRKQRMVRVASCWKERSSEDEDKRSWGLGKGWTGKAWQRGEQGDRDPYVIEGDAATTDARQRYDADGQEEPDDYERFRSVVAIPFSLRGQSATFGVVTVTSSRPQVFGVEANSVQLRNFNSIKIFAQLVASLASVETDPR